MFSSITWSILTLNGCHHSKYSTNTIKICQQHYEKDFRPALVKAGIEGTKFKLTIKPFSEKFIILSTQFFHAELDTKGEHLWSFSYLQWKRGKARSWKIIKMFFNLDENLKAIFFSYYFLLIIFTRIFFVWYLLCLHFCWQFSCAA